MTVGPAVSAARARFFLGAIRDTLCTSCGHRTRLKSSVLELATRRGYRLADMATPKKRPTKSTDTFIKIRVSDEQKRILEAAAMRDGMDLSAFARHRMIERARALGFEI